jgi:PPOX class probable F420-dependent enzyme
MPQPKRSEPKASRPYMPGYGLDQITGRPGKRLPWSQVSELLAASRSYWVCTVRPDGRPHAVPVWGQWLDETFYFLTGRQSRKTRNLAENPQVVVHIESGEDVVILEGAAEEVTDASLLGQVADAYAAKYDWRLEPEFSLSWAIYALRPRVAFTFREDLEEEATRWRFHD